MIWVKITLFFVGSFLIQWGVLVGLRRRAAFQHIYELAPASHQSKAKTPSSGGIGLILSLMWGVGVFGIGHKPVLITLGLAIAMGAIGLADDILKRMRAKNGGLSVIQKLILQITVAVVFVLAFGTHLTVASGGLWVFAILSMTNATNLTDGLDGLLSGLMLLSLGGLLLVMTLAHGWLALDPALVTLIGVSIGTLLVFLRFNWHPAKIFMGDVGSQMLGGLLCGLAFWVDSMWLLIPLGAVYVIEVASVAIQVVCFKWSRKRVFLMAPFHHHFELMGIPETWVVPGLWALAVGFQAVYVAALLFFN